MSEFLCERFFFHTGERTTNSNHCQPVDAETVAQDPSTTQSTHTRHNTPHSTHSTHTDHIQIKRTPHATRTPQSDHSTQKPRSELFEHPERGWGSKYAPLKHFFQFDLSEWGLVSGVRCLR